MTGNANRAAMGNGPARCCRATTIRQPHCNHRIDWYRIASLREIGWAIKAGVPVGTDRGIDPTWLACQLWDLADLLEVLER